MEQPHVHVITQEDSVIVRGTLPGVTVHDVNVTPHSVILIGEHHGHQFVQELSFEADVDSENAVSVFAESHLTIIIPRDQRTATI